VTAHCQHDLEKVGVNPDVSRQEKAIQAAKQTFEEYRKGGIGRRPTEPRQKYQSSAVAVHAALDPHIRSQWQCRLHVWSQRRDDDYGILSEAGSEISRQE
jgi:hypothetical protein